MRQSLKHRSLSILLGGVLLFALGIRLWGIRFGLPYAYHVDEPTYVSAALNLGAGIIGRQPNPTGFSNILFGEYAAYFLIGRATGLFTSAADFEQNYRSDPTTFILFARLTSALLGTLTVLVVFWLGRVKQNSLVGIVAAWFTAAAFLHVRDSHYGVPDISMVFFVSLAVLLSIISIQRSNRWYLYFGALAAGYACATKWTALPVFIPLILAAFYEFKDHSKANQSKSLWSHFGQWILISGILFGVGFFIGGFQLFLKPLTFIEYAQREAQAGEAGGFGLWQVDTVSGWIFYLKTLSYGLGPVLLIFSMIGIFCNFLTAIQKKSRTSLLLLTFPLIYYLLMGTTQHYFARYTLPLIPFLVIFGAEIIVITGDWINRRHQRLGWSLATLLIILASIQPLFQNFQHNKLLVQEDTRTLAKKWVEANIPEETKIAVDWPVHGPPLSSSDNYFPSSQKLYDVNIIGGIGLADHDLTWYRAQEFDYLIASSFIYDIPLVYQKRNEERKEFYASLEQQFDLVREFRPYSNGATEPPFIFDEIYGPVVSLWYREQPGPTLKIYKVNQ